VGAGGHVVDGGRHAPYFDVTPVTSCRPDRVNLPGDLGQSAATTRLLISLVVSIRGQSDAEIVWNGEDEGAAASPPKQEAAVGEIEEMRTGWLVQLARHRRSLSVPAPRSPLIAPHLLEECGSYPLLPCRRLA